MKEVGKLRKDYKVAFVDFDDTLCIHTNRAFSSDMWLVRSVLGMECFEDSLVNKELRDYLRELKKNGCVIHCITQGNTTLSYKAKRKAIDSYYVDENGEKLVDDLIYSGTTEGKTYVMNVYLRSLAYNTETNTLDENKLINKKDAVLIDDNADTLQTAIKQGYDVLTPLQVTNSKY